jgi:signal transduction histidine kinase
MFKSATLKLTGRYLLILMSVSLIFSIAIFQIANHEVETRLEGLQTSLKNEQIINFQPSNIDWQKVQTNQSYQTALNLFVGLAYINAFIFIIGGAGCYILAKRTLRPIEEAHEAQSRFTSDASHELRTPLAAMQAELEVALRDPKATKQDLQNTIKSSLEEVEKLNQLFQMLLNLSRLEHDKLDKSIFNLYSVTADMLRRFNEQAKRVKFKAPIKNLTVHANQPAIEELITILIDNALKYSPNKSIVNITISKRSTKVYFEISNEGQGINKEVLPHIFDRFYQADASRTSRKRTGYGLGLALAKKIVELSGGELSATSAPNYLTAFKFSLPISRQPQPKNQKHIL